MTRRGQIDLELYALPQRIGIAAIAARDGPRTARKLAQIEGLGTR